MHGLPEKPVEDRAAASGLVGVAHLTQDLALSRHHRVEPGSDAEEVERGRFVAQAVELEAFLGQSGKRTRFGHLGIGVSEVELGAIAGREAHRLSSLGERFGETRGTREVERHALAHLNGGKPVRGSDENEVHAKWLVGRPRWRAMTTAKPASAR